jgi:hypothetical protein
VLDIGDDREHLCGRKTDGPLGGEGWHDAGLTPRPPA